MKTRGILLIIVALCLSMIAPSSLASDRDVHDAYMLKVLFGNDYKEENYNAKELAAIEALEAASYLAVDQYNGKGAEELNKPPPKRRSKKRSSTAVTFRQGQAAAPCLRHP